VPKKKKVDPNQMDDQELLRQVFPERVVKRIEEQLRPYRDSNNEPETPTNAE